MRILGCHHTSYTVADLERSLAFYSGLLGLEVLWQRRIEATYFREIVGMPECVVRGAHLRIPGSAHLLELFEYVQPRGTPADVRTNNPGSSHLALIVDDLQAAYEELSRQGATFRSPPVTKTVEPGRGGRSVYLLDPDGITVELHQDPRPEGAG